MPKKRLISVVDDDECVLEALEALIHSVGYEVATFSSAEDFLQSDLVQRTSALISDWQMPGMSGGDLQEQLIAGGYRIPIIFVTAVCNERDRTRVLKAGALCFIEKPFDANSLIEHLSRIFDEPC